MTFLKLTEMGSGSAQWINVAYVERILLHGKGGSALHYAADQAILYVKESPEEIMEKLAEAEQRCNHAR